MKTLTLIDSSGLRVDLEGELGRGGEGTVYHVRGWADVVAKVYHKPPDPERLRKLQVMVRQANPELTSQCAWPRDVLRDPNAGGIVGLLMPKVSGFCPLHQCYNPQERIQTLPQWTFKHLLCVARNLAAAFDTVHTAQAVIGDVNPQGVKVCPRSGTVRLIDCDSFQVRDGSGWLRCTVGSAHYTPPELAGVTLSEVVRRVEHDAFGLAVLIFQLLFVGRHPFAGTSRADEHVTIEKAIRERCYAFASPMHRTKLGPPPRVPLPQELTPTLAELFERAFLTMDRRPLPKEWMQALSSLLDKHTWVTCGATPTHVYLRDAGACAWCAISRVDRGIDYFPPPLPDDATLYRSGAEFERLCSEIDALLSSLQKHMDVPQPGRLGIARTGRPWPAEADPTRLGPPPPPPPQQQPLPPTPLPLPEVPEFVPPPDPPEPTYTPLPPEPPPFEFKPSRPRPTPPPLPELPVLVLPEPPPEPRLELLTRYSGVPYSEKLARKCVNRLFHCSWEGLAWWLSLGGTIAAAGASWVVSAWPTLAVPTAGLAGVFGVLFVALETVRRRWVAQQVREMPGRWLELLAESSSVWPSLRRQAVATLHAELEAKRLYEENVMRYQQICEQRRVEFEREDARVRSLRAVYAPLITRWEADMQREREEQEREYEKIRREALARGRQISKANAKLYEDWRQACQEQREWARAEHAQKCREVNEQRRQIEQRNAAAAALYETELQRWKEQVEAEKRYREKYAEVKSRYDTEVSLRQAALNEARKAYQSVRVGFEAAAAKLQTESGHLSLDVMSRRIKWSLPGAELELKLKMHSTFQAALMQELQRRQISEIVDNVIGESVVERLAREGISTAADISAARLSMVRGFRTGKRSRRLLEWRRLLEEEFKRKWAAGAGVAVIREINGQFWSRLSGMLREMQSCRARATQLQQEHERLRNEQQKLRQLAEKIEQAEADLKAVPPWPCGRGV